MNSRNGTVYGLVNNKKSNTERKNIIKYLDGQTPGSFITASEIDDIIGFDDYLVASSVTELGNNTEEVMAIITPTLDKKASIIFAIGELKFFPDDKPAEVFPKIGRIYKMFRSKRSKIGLEARKKQGLSIGRKPGKAKKLKLDKFEATILETLLLGKSKSELCKQIKTSRSTLNDWLKARGYVHNENVHVRVKKTETKSNRHTPVALSSSSSSRNIPPALTRNKKTIDLDLDTEMLEILIDDDDVFKKCLNIIATMDNQQLIVRRLEQKLQLMDDPIPFELLESYMEMRV